MGVASISGGSNARMDGWGAVTQKWVVEGPQRSSCSCYHEGKITGGIIGPFPFTNPLSHSDSLEHLHCRVETD